MFLNKWQKLSFSCRCKTNRKEKKSYFEELKGLSQMKRCIKQDFMRSVPGPLVLNNITIKLNYRITIKLVVNANLGKPTKMLVKQIRISKDPDKLDNCSKKKKKWLYFLSTRLTMYIWTEFINCTNRGQKKAVKQKLSVSHKLYMSQWHDAASVQHSPPWHQQYSNNHAISHSSGKTSADCSVQFKQCG